MANKEKIEQLTDYIDKLKKLAENIYEREIYPVSFFSQAFDITNKIQDSLHQIEIEQVELFEKQMKEHQAQIRNIQHIEKKLDPVQTLPMIQEKLSEAPSPVEDLQTVSSKTNHHPTEKEAMIEDKSAETAQTPPIIKEPLLKTSSFADNPQTLSSDTSQHITKEEPVLTKEIEMQLPFLEEKLQTAVNSLDKKFEKKTLSDLKKAFTLNDRFRFCRELFSSNENLMNQTFTELNQMESYNHSITYIKESFDWDWEEEVTNEFISMIEKRYN